MTQNLRFLNLPYKFFFILTILFIQNDFAHSQVKNHGISLHAGINSGVLGGGGGPSLSLHFSGRRDKIFQLESQLLWDYHAGKTFLSGKSQKNTGVGLLAGLRLNLRPEKNWNPSLFFFPGVMYSSETISNSPATTNSGISAGISVGISSLFHQKHMLSLGITGSEYISSLFLKYGFWFSKK
jgi:hypothetical protein